jgi:WD40 repeat protein
VETGTESSTFRGDPPVVFSPDGRIVAVASREPALKLWDPETDREVATVPGGTPVAMSVDASRLVAACGAPSRDARGKTRGGPELVLYDLATGVEVAKLPGHSGPVTTCAFDPGGRRIASGSVDSTLRVWDAETGAGIALLTGHSGPITDCAFSPGGRRIVSASEDETVRIWDAEEGSELVTFKGHSAEVWKCAFTADGRRVVSGGFQGLRVWDAEAGRELANPRIPVEGHYVCALSPDTRRMVTGYAKLALWEVDSGRKVATIEGHQGGVEACWFTPDGEELVTTGKTDLMVKRWKVETGELMASSQSQWGPVVAFAWSSRWPVVRAASISGTLEIRDASTGKVVRALTGHRGSVSACAFSPDGKRVASECRGTVHLWELANGNEITRLEAESPLVAGSGGRTPFVVFSPDAKRLVSSSTDGILKVWDAELAADLTTLEPIAGSRAGLRASERVGWAHTGAFTVDGRSLLSRGESTITIWDVATGTELATIEPSSRLTAMATCPGSALIACGDAGGGLSLLKPIAVGMGPSIVTPVDFGDGFVIRCPYCTAVVSFRDGWLGKEMTCPEEGCGGPWKVNPFRCERPSWAGCGAQ